MKRNNIVVISLVIASMAASAGLSGCGTVKDILGTVDEVLNPEEPLEVESQSEGMYAYETLNETEKRVYDEVVYAIRNREESVLLATTDVDSLEKVYMAMRYDYCDLFWSDSYEYELYSNSENEPIKLYFNPIYNMDEEEQNRLQVQIDQEADRMLEGIQQEVSDYEKVLYVYRTLIEETDYSVEAENNQNIISTFVTHETVCQGYSYGAQYLLDKLGVPCITVCGTSEGENHSWNLIKMDGEYYYMDVTWGEVEYWEELEVPEEITGAVAEEADTVNYSYLGVSDTDEMFMANHIALDVVPMPECTATENNYYVHEGLYFDHWDKHEVGAVIRKAYDEGKGEVFLKFADSELYEQAFEYLVENNHWAEYCDEQTISYVDQFDMNVLMLDFMR